MKDIILYVVSRVERPFDLGAVKLHKILWFTDLALMYRAGTTACGETFIKKPRGPWGSHVDKAIKALEKEGRLVEKAGSLAGFNQRQFFALVEPDLTRLKAIEISLLEQIIGIVCNSHTASSISELTHDDLWERTPENRVMPADCVFDRLRAPPSAEDWAWAQQPVDAETKAELDAWMAG
ncbi:MAG: DUF4065 domain-containing protein [Alphaproteobacteria bacterium]|nr:DUF4065 domain-containing protein [Alphaproteobacteria bacterium]